MVWVEKLKNNAVSMEEVIKKFNITQKEIDLAEKIVNSGGEPTGVSASGKGQMVKDAGITDFIYISVYLP